MQIGNNKGECLWMFESSFSALTSGGAFTNASEHVLDFCYDVIHILTLRTIIYWKR